MTIPFVRVIVAVSCAAFVLLAAQPASQIARAETEGAVAIGCEFLFGTIDGDPNDAVTQGDRIDACDGIDAIDVSNLGDGLGDEDGALEPTDLASIDQDANQIQDGGVSVSDEILLFAFVDNDGVVTFDAESGVNVFIHDDGGGFSLDGDANAETCTAADDLDCDTNALSDGDGVVVATASDNLSGDPGDSIDVDMFQADDTGQVNTETLNIVGAPNNIFLDVLKTSLGTSGDASDVDQCREDSDYTVASQLDDTNRTILRATVVDNDAVELTRIQVSFQVNNPNIADFDSDAAEPANEPKSHPGITVDLGSRGIGSFLVLCGGTITGTATVTASESVNSGDADAFVQVVGPPANVALSATPSQTVDCDGVDAAAIIATVTDAGGNAVADGTQVNFSVTSVGTVDPVNTVTTNGAAITTFRGFSSSNVGVPVIVTSGNAQNSILMQCIGTSNDSDGDGMPNGYETAHACLNPNAADGSLDPDFDDFTSFSEFLQGLDPCDADTDNDTRTDAADNCPLAPNTSQTNTDVVVNPPGDFAGDACDANDDNDGCTDLKETGANPILGGDRDPLVPWDFFDVPAPAGPAVGQNGLPILTAASVRNKAINLQDVGVVLAYVGRSSASIDYSQDANSDGYADGTQLDRTPSANGAKLWRSGPPNGAVSIQDVGVALAQVGHRCNP